jgi:ribonucleoside-diphosphate reductase alpha chain
MRKFSKTANEILLKRYSLPNETTVEQIFKRVCNAVGSNDEHRNRLMSYINKKWFMFASPIISDSGSKRGVGISCNLNYVDDSLDGLTKHFAENMVLSSNGAGVAAYFGDLRSTGTGTSRGSKTSGAINFMKIYGAQFEACQQGTRRGAYAAYLPISHPEIMEFLALRKQTASGEYSRSINTGVTITDKFMHAVRDNTTWDLIDPHSKEVTHTLPATTIWHFLLEMRAETGYPYIVNIDTVNRAKYPTSPDILQSNLCSEVLLPTASDRTAVCCLSSVNLDKFDEWKDDPDFIGDIVEMLDNVLDNVLNNNETRIIREGDFWRSKNSIRKERAIGLGTMGFHTYLQRNSIPIESPTAVGVNKKMFELISKHAEERSLKLGAERGLPEEAITGHRNLYRIALAPNATSSIILGDVSPGIEPYPSNLYVHKTLSGSETRVNPVLERLVKEKGLNQTTVLSDLVKNNGSVQHLPYFTDWEKSVFKTAWEINQHTLTSLAADRQPFICQGQSLNLFFTSNATRKYVNEVHFKAWEKGVKTLYYYRSTEAAFTSSEKDCESCEG